MNSRNVLMVLANTFATDARVGREAKALAAHGFSVQVLCWDRRAGRPLAERINQCSVRNVRLGRTTVLPSSRLYYFITALLFQVIVFLWVVKQIRKVRALILHAHDFNVLLGCAVARQLLKNRIRLVYDCHELTPGVYREWYGSFVSTMVGQLEFAALHQVDAVVAANEAIRSYLRLASSVPAIVVHTCPASEEVPTIESSDAKKKLGLDGLFVILFTGRVRQDYDLDLILSVALELREKSFSDFRFVFIGPPETTACVVNTVVNEGLQSFFDFRGWVPDKDLLLYYAASDFCFIVTRDLGPNTKVLTPIKLFESMACGVPVVVRGGTLAADVVQRWGCGIVLDTARSSFSAELMALRHNSAMLRSLGEAGRRAFRLVYNWDRMQARLFQLYAEL